MEKLNTINGVHMILQLVGFIVLRGFPEVLLQILKYKSLSIVFKTSTEGSWAIWSTNGKVVGSVPLPVVSAVVWHLVLGHQHALVRNTSVSAMSELVHEAAGGPEPGHIVHTWFHSAARVCFKKGTDFLVGCR